MVVAEDILEEYKNEAVRNSKFYIPIIILFSIFLVFLILDMFIYIESFTWHGFDPDIPSILSVLIPGAGLAFFVAKKKIGWFISTIFNSFICFAGIGAILFIGESGESDMGLQLTHARPIFILTITTSLCILLQTKTILRTFKISNLSWFLAIGISACCAMSLIMFG